MANKYPNPAAFRQALKERIKRRADERGMLFNRYRQLVLFERFAARVYEACGSDVVVKGGLVMELRLERARTTRDVDALLKGDVEEKLSDLRRLAAQSGDDWLSFELGRPESVVEHEGEHIAYEAYRVDVRAQIGGKPFGDPFHFDVSTGDKLVGRPEHQRGTDLFEFVGIEPVEHRVYPREVHVAEKLHAWPLPRDRPNSRVKDLVDLGLMAEGLEFDGESLREAIDATSEFRDTHPVPETVPEVPESWPRQYRRLEDENGLPWDSVEELAGVVEGFLRTILQGTEVGEWDPERGDRW